MARRSGVSLDGFLLDLRLALRSLRSSPGFTMLALVLLTMGIGAATGIFAVVDAIVLRPLPFPGAERLVAIGEVHHRLVARGLSNLGSVAPPNFFDWRASLTTVQGLAASAKASGFTLREGNQPEELRALRVTANLLDVLGIHPQIGRPFRPSDETEGRDGVALISDSFWRRRFGGDPDVVGRTIRLDSGTWEIVGVLPRTFEYPFGLERPTDVFVPYVAPESARSRGEDRNYTLQVVGRLEPGVSIEDAAHELASVTARMARDYPPWFADRSPGILSLHEATVGRVQGWMMVLLGAVGFVLLVACVNVASMMLARMTTRSRDIMIRTALGATLWRIARGQFLEALVLTFAGALCGLVVAWWGISVFRSLLPPTLPRVASIHIDARVLLIATLIAFGVACISGFLPTLWTSRRSAREVLDEGNRMGPTGPRRRGAAALVAAEVALATVPLAGAGLFAASFLRVVRVELGLDPHHVLIIDVAPRVTGAETTPELPDAVGLHAAEQVLARVRRLPGVQSAAALAGGLPFSGSWNASFITVGDTTFAGPDDAVQVRQVTPDYARVTRTAVKRGRYISDADTTGSPLVVVLNEHAVRRFFGNRDPLGAIVQLDGAPRVVIGVVGDVRVRGPELPVSPEAYFPMKQSPALSTNVLIRTTDDETGLAADVRRIVLTAAPGVPAEARTLASQLQPLVAQRELNMLLTAVFGVLAVGITAVGIYGVVAYTVAQQHREIGVRMALGATRVGIVRMVLGWAALLVGSGLAVGTVGAFILAQSIRAFLFDVRPGEPAVFGGVVAVLTFTGLLAALVPALWAARLDPIDAMRRS